MYLSSDFSLTDRSAADSAQWIGWIAADGGQTSGNDTHAPQKLDR